MSKRKSRERTRRERPAAAVTGGGARAAVTGRRYRDAVIALAVVVVLATVIVGQIRPSPATLTAAAEPQRGAQLYEKYCVSCHGADGTGGPGWKYRERAAPALDSSGHAWHHEDEQLLSMILDKPAPDSAMPAWRGVLTRDDALDVIGYIKSLWTPYIRANCQGAKHMSCMGQG